MSYKGIVTRVYARGYDRRAEKLFTRDERRDVEAAIAADPQRWPVVAGTGGCRKARAALAGRGKRGGARIVYFFLDRKGRLAFIDVYAKNEKEDLTVGDKAALRRFAAEIAKAPT
jgi:hypothetical protein